MKVWVVHEPDDEITVCLTKSIAEAVSEKMEEFDIFEEEVLEEFPRTSFPPTQQELADQMSEMSEERWRASWFDGLEFILWRALTGEGIAYWSISDLIELAKLHGHARGWFGFDENGKRFVTTEEWLVIFEAREKVKDV